MAKAILTEPTKGTNLPTDTIDIHCGGVDLKFPHHENEIAQSNCAHDGAPLANYWVHNEFLNMGKDKMSKSLGNVKLIHDLKDKYDSEVLRLALIKASHRSELKWTSDLLFEAREQLDSWYRSLKDIKEWISEEPASDFIDAITNDLNTPKALFVLSEMGQSLNYKYQEPFNYNKAAGEFVASANLLGLLQKDPEEWFRGGLDYDALVAEYDSVRAQALAAKEAGDKAKMGEMFKRSDEIRDQFKAEGVVIESGAGGKSGWRKA